nr:recombinase-like helix-turn-helix domain-containing protein [Caballeronia sp. BR00000012568055]
MMDRYLEPHQARQRPPTQYENLLGDAIERAFAQGITVLPELVAYLNEFGPRAQNADVWTEENFRAEMARLGQ